MVIVEYTSLKPKNFEGARDMDTAIFDVSKSMLNRQPLFKSTSRSITQHFDFITGWKS